MGTTDWINFRGWAATAGMFVAAFCLEWAEKYTTVLYTVYITFHNNSDQAMQAIAEYSHGWMAREYIYVDRIPGTRDDFISTIDVLAGNATCQKLPYFSS